jgi:alpha-galactosidase
MKRSDVKVAVIGAGSYVFGPSVLRQATYELHLSGVEMALMDVDPAALEVVSALGRRMAQESGAGVAISSHQERGTALDGADFVICCAAPQMAQRHEVDYAIIRRLAPGHMITEFGGIAGISYSLRQMAFIRDLAADIRKQCPQAWLLDTANPLPRVCQAAHESGVRTAGFCSVSLDGYGMLSQLVYGVAEAYPWTSARERMQLTWAGVNHFCWSLAAVERASGRDLLPAARQAVAEGRTAGQPRCEEMLLSTGYLLLPGDDHIADFLPPDPRHVYRKPYHGDPAERRAEWAALRDQAEGKVPMEGPLQVEAWEKPMQFVAGLALGLPVDLPSLNLVNDGQVANLPRGVFVETASRATAEGPQTPSVTLPAVALPYCTSAAQVTDTLVRAGMTGSRALVHRAVELDPTIVDKQAGLAAIDECLRAHADMLGPYV